MQIEEIHFEEKPGNDGSLGVITLNRPKALNALNHEMFNAIDHHLSAWAGKPHIKAVLIRAVQGRAFCAGGDVRLAHERKKMNDPRLEHFFRDEYVMNRLIFNYPKPYIALLNGITMGGGAGISIHGSHRVATEHLVFAMPETSIGFFPDIGGTYFLSHLPHKMGFYLGLTGEAIPYNDCYALGLVDAVIHSDSQNKLIELLVDSALPDNETISQIINSLVVSVPKSTLLEHKSEIVSCFSHDTVEKIIHALEETATDWCKKIATILKTKSPTSLKVTLQALIRGEKMNFEECMQMEYRIMQQFLRSHDFFEGIRAALIDKDKNPRWKPTTLEDVTTHDVMKYFSPSKEEDLSQIK